MKVEPIITKSNQTHESEAQFTLRVSNLKEKDGAVCFTFQFFDDNGQEYHKTFLMDDLDREVIFKSLIQSYNRTIESMKDDFKNAAKLNLKKA